MTQAHPGITGVASISIGTDNLPRLLDFYRDTLGLKLRSQRPHNAQFEFGELRLIVGLHSEIHGATREPQRMMVNFIVPDITVAHQLLVEAGVDFIRPPSPEGWGGMIATFKDPDGNLLQLFQLKP